MAHPTLLAAGLLAASTAWVTACDEPPRDPGGTLDRVTDGVLHVGWSEHPPWCAEAPQSASVDVRPRGAREPVGRDVDLVHEVARTLGAQIVWVHGETEALLHRLERFELDLVVCGGRPSSPWKKQVGFTSAVGEDHALAVPPGENGWLMVLDRIIADRHRRAHPSSGPES